MNFKLAELNLWMLETSTSVSVHSYTVEQLILKTIIWPADIGTGFCGCLLLLQANLQWKNVA